jgi:hypothetical protein
MKNNRFKEFTFEELELLCKHLKGKPVPECKVSGFWRSFKFERLGCEYKITWFKNESSLYINGLGQIRFRYIAIDGFWPNHFRNNLNLSLDGEEQCAIIPIEAYENHT